MTTEALAALVLIAASEGADRKPNDAFEWYGSANDMAVRLLPALAASGYSLVRTDDLAGLRAIEEAARDADPTPGQAITSAPAIAALRAALKVKGTRP